MKFLVIHETTQVPYGVYEAEQENPEAIQVNQPVLHIPMLNGASAANYQLVTVSGVLQAHPKSLDLQKLVKDAMEFGQSLLQLMAAENVGLGITQAGMTGVVRKRSQEVILALMTGSLYDAMAEARAIPAEHKDGTFISDARLLSIINRIEDYMKLPRSTSL